MPSLDQIREATSRFWSKVDKSGDCWLWTGAKNLHGYGQMRIGGRSIRTPMSAHRVSYILACGDIPEGMAILHHCDTPACVNPAHLYAGTQSRNIRDAYSRNRKAVVRVGNLVRGEQNGHARLNADSVRQIRDFYARGEATPTELAQRFGVAAQTVWHVIYRQTWRQVE